MEQRWHWNRSPGNRISISILMNDPIKTITRQIEISGNRTMNIYTFEDNSNPMPEMTKEDIEQPENPHG